MSLSFVKEEQRTTATYAITDPEYLRWHWTTTRTFPRNGVALHDLDAGQQEAAYALLRASISEVGFQKSMDIMGLQPEIGGDPLNWGSGGGFCIDWSIWRCRSVCCIIFGWIGTL